MSDPQTYFVYILASHSRALYTGVTSDLLNRMYQHKQGTLKGHTSKYKINRLVHFERYSEPLAAIRREKEIKGWLRIKKLDLIESGNPQWLDLSENFKQ